MADLIFKLNKPTQKPLSVPGAGLVGVQPVKAQSLLQPAPLVRPPAPVVQQPQPAFNISNVIRGFNAFNEQAGSNIVHSIVPNNIITGQANPLEFLKGVTVQNPLISPVLDTASRAIQAPIQFTEQQKAEQLIQLAKKNGVTLTPEQIKAFYPVSNALDNTRNWIDPEQNKANTELGQRISTGKGNGWDIANAVLQSAGLIPAGGAARIVKKVDEIATAGKTAEGVAKIVPKVVEKTTEVVKPKVITKVVAPKVVTASKDVVKMEKQVQSGAKVVSPWSADGKLLTKDKRTLDIKIARSKNPARKAELMAERKARFGAPVKSRIKKGDVYTLSKQAEKDVEKTAKGTPGSNLWSDFKRLAIDPYSEFAKSDRLNAVKKGVRESAVPAEKKLTKLANDVRNRDGLLQEQIKHTKLSDGRSLQKVMQKYPHGERMKNFLIYVENKSDLENRGIKGGTRLNPQYSNDQVRKAVKDFEQANKGAAQDARALKGFKDHLENEGVDYGSLTHKDAKRAQESRNYYFPTKQAESGKDKIRITNTLKGSTREQKIIKSREGGGQAQYNWAAIVDRFAGDKEQNLQARFFRELVKRADDGTVGARRVALKKGDIGGEKGLVESAFGAQLYHGLENGEHVAVELDRNLAKAFKSFTGSQQKELIAALANIPANVAKFIFTGIANPVFHALNLVKNPILLLHNNGIGAIGIRPLLSGVGGIFNAGKFSEHGLVKFGANQIKATQSVATQKIRAEMLALDKTDPVELAKFGIRHPWTTVKSVGRAIDHVAAFSDRTFRSMAARHDYIIAKRGGATEQQAMERAAEVYNESMGNFNRVTDAARTAEPLLLYSGAIQAGARAFARSYIDRPVQTLLMDAAFVTAIGGSVAANQSSEAGKKFYKDMQDSNKQYILDDNFVIVAPNAYKDPTTNEWVGVVKVPLAPDYRPLNRVTRKLAMGQAPNPEDWTGHLTGDIVKGIREDPQTNPTLNALSTGFNRNPRTGEPIVSEFESKTKSPSEQVDPGYTSKTAVNIAKSTGISAKQVDSFLDNFSLAGDIVQNREGTPLETLKTSFLKQFVKVTGQSDGGKYMKDFERVTSTIKDEKDFNAFSLLHTAKGEAEKNNPNTSAERAEVLLTRPEVLKAENALNAAAVARGEESNPFYNLSSDEQQKVLLYRSSKSLNNAKQSYDANGQPLFTALGLDGKWYQDFRNKENSYYDNINSKTKAAATTATPDKPGVVPSASTTTSSGEAISTYSGAQYVQDDKMDALQAEYSALPKGTGARTAYLNNHPELLEYWSKKDGFTEAERFALGLNATSEDSSSSKYGSGKKATINPYSFLVSSDSSNGKVKSTVNKNKTTVKYKSGKTIQKAKVSLKKSKA